LEKEQKKEVNEEKKKALLFKHLSCGRNPFFCFGLK